MPATRSLPSARVLTGIVLVAIIVAGGAALLLLDGAKPPTVEPQHAASSSVVPAVPVPLPATVPVPVPVSAAPSPPPPTPPAPVSSAPAFDIVQVAPGGEAVMAGRAEPGATVTVLDAGKPLGTAQANGNGAWTFIPAAPLPPGAIELTLSSQPLHGPAVASEARVLLVIPPAATAHPARPLVVLAQPGMPSRLLQAPEASTPGRLGLDTVDYDEHGAIRFSGTAPARAPLRVYVDTARVGDAVADGSGHWILSPANPVEPGVHRLRLDQLAPDGRVASRVELPFLRETLALTEVPAGSVVVQPKQNLWRLARRAYGTGMRYTVIYQANRDQIRDPRLIYAGQVFAIPGDAPAK